MDRVDTEVYLCQLLKTHAKALGDDPEENVEGMPGMEVACNILLTDGTLLGEGYQEFFYVRSYLMFGVLLELWRPHPIDSTGKLIMTEKRFIPYSSITYISEIVDQTK